MSVRVWAAVAAGLDPNIQRCLELRSERLAAQKCRSGQIYFLLLRGIRV